MWKQPSAEVNPASQFGSWILNESIKGLGIFTILGKAYFNSELIPDKPLFIDALILTIFGNPEPFGLQK